MRTQNAPVPLVFWNCTVPVNEYSSVSVVHCAHAPLTSNVAKTSSRAHCERRGDMATSVDFQNTRFSQIRGHSTGSHNENGFKRPKSTKRRDKRVRKRGTQTRKRGGEEGRCARTAIYPCFKAMTTTGHGKGCNNRTARVIGGPNWKGATNGVTKRCETAAPKIGTTPLGGHMSILQSTMG